MRSKKYFVISDLDCTLLNRQSKLSALSQKVLHQLYHHDIPFCPATARSLHSMRPLFKDTPLHLPFVEQNGAFITDLTRGIRHKSYPVDSAICCDILHFAQQQNLALFVSAVGEKDKMYYHHANNEGAAWYLNSLRVNQDPRYQSNPGIGAAFTESISCFVFVDLPEILLPIKSLFEDRYQKDVICYLTRNHNAPQFGWLFIQNPLATKRQGVQDIAQMYSLQNHQWVVFGDGENDLALFDLPAYKIAVANAIPALKECADLVLSHNHDEDAVANWIVENILTQ